MSAGVKGVLGVAHAIGGAEAGTSAFGDASNLGAQARSFQDAMRRAQAQLPLEAERAPPQTTGRVESGSAVWDTLAESISARDKKLRTVFSGDPSRPETVVDALNFMQRHQKAMLEFHAVLQVAENLKNSVNKLTNMQ